jgi:ACT domain-containing protein
VIIAIRHSKYYNLDEVDNEYSCLSAKDTQDVKNQKLAILEFAQREMIDVNDYVEITVSSRKSTKERKIDLLLEKLERVTCSLLVS